jgi:hypothetical protein
MSVNPPKRPPNIEPGPGPHSKRTRSYRHCKYCRDSRKKCTREAEAEERCVRCVKRNLPCSADLSLQEQMAGGSTRNNVGVGFELATVVGDGGVTCRSWRRHSGDAGDGGDGRDGITSLPLPPPAFTASSSPFSIPQSSSSSFTNRQILLPKPPSTISTPSSQTSSNASFFSQHASHVSSIRDAGAHFPSSGTGTTLPESARFPTLQEKLDHG